jgi:hypothetical protein
MRGKFLLILVLFTSLINLKIPSSIHAESLKRRIAIGVGKPYVSLKYGLSPKFSIEARGAFGTGVNMYGARLYYNFTPKDKVVLFFGVEGGYIRFSKDDVSGKGYVIYPCLGGECFILKRLALTLDIGPAFIYLEEDEFNLSIKGVEYLFNLGINFYLY